MPGNDSLFVACIAGPTGAGKTAAALALAEALPISVLNADSRQTYRDFPIITAQPSPAEQTHCPHLLYGFLPTEETLGAGAFARMAGKTIDEERSKDRLPVLVGGTGLYFRALLEGIAEIPAIPAEISAAWQQRCREEGGETLHALLTEQDPVYAAKIHPNDRQRITRALEVLTATGKPFSWWHARPMPQTPYTACKVGIRLPMPELEPLLARRIDLMLEQGALDEARRALERCPNPAAPGWSGIGCAEIRQYLEGTISLDECRTLWLKNTRAYAKRQNTWFRADSGITWFLPQDVRKIVDFILERYNTL